MTHHHFPKLHCSNNDVILSNTYGHQSPPLPSYVEDKVYLSMLAESITKVGILSPEDEGGCGTNGIDTEVRAAASDALNFLRSREDFWEQVDVGKEQQQDASSRTTRRKKSRKVLQSTRLHYIM